MRFSIIGTILGALCFGVPCLGYDEGQFLALRCAAGVGFAYSENNCNSPSIVDKCFKTWTLKRSFPISDGNGGSITVRIFRVVANNRSKQDVWLLFPGSKAPSNFVTDFNLPKDPETFSGRCPDCQIHRGILGAFKGGLNAITSNTKDVMNEFRDDNLVIAGGSLGGALAALSFAEFKTNSGRGLNPLYGVSFGQPRTGNTAWGAFMNQLTLANTGFPLWQRVSYEYDAVVQSPPREYAGDWLHHGGEIWTRNQPSGARPNAASTTYLPLQAFGAEPSTGTASKSYFERSIPDHTKYPGYVGTDEVPGC